MTLEEYLRFDPHASPLDRLVTDGGMVGIFRTIGCIGDSLSSGEFESLDENGVRGYHDCFDYSWGQYLARDAGCTVRNFSRGGMTAAEYMRSFAEEQGFWSEDRLCQAYILALGVNDIINQNQTVGSTADIDPADWTKNADTFAGWYGAIIQRLRSMQPYARFFLVTMPDDGDNDPRKAAHAALLHELAAYFDRTYVIDLFAHAPAQTAEYRKKYYMSGHLNAAGYRLTAWMIESYIDWLIRKDPQEFAAAGFIGTQAYNVTVPR